MEKYYYAYYFIEYYGHLIMRHERFMVRDLVKWTLAVATRTEICMVNKVLLEPGLDFSGKFFETKLFSHFFKGYTIRGCS